MRPLALVTLLVAWSAAAEQPLATYPGAVHTRIGNDVVIGGELYRLAYFLSDDSLKKVARWFVKSWEGQGYPVRIDGDFVTEGTVSAFYTREGLVRSIVLCRHEGKTLGFTALKDLWVRPPPVKRAPLPVLEGALFSTQLEVRQSAGGSEHRTTLIGKGMQAARVELEAIWVEAGYALRRETRAENGGRVLELTKGGAQVVISLVAIDDQTTGIDETLISATSPNVEPGR